MQHSASSPALLALGMIGPFLFEGRVNHTPTVSAETKRYAIRWLPATMHYGRIDTRASLDFSRISRPHIQHPRLSSSSRSTSGCTWARATLSTAGQPTFLTSVHQTSCYGVTWRGYRTKGAYKILTQLRRSVGAAARAGSVDTCGKTIKILRWRADLSFAKKEAMSNMSCRGWEMGMA